MIKGILAFIGLIAIASFVLANNYIQINVNEIEEDIPSPINPVLVKQIRDCGKIDLINRNSPNYNPNALVDGSLEECVN